MRDLRKLLTLRTKLLAQARVLLAEYPGAAWSRRQTIEYERLIAAVLEIDATLHRLPVRLGDGATRRAA